MNATHFINLNITEFKNDHKRYKYFEFNHNGTLNWNRTPIYLGFEFDKKKILRRSRDNQPMTINNFSSFVDIGYNLKIGNVISGIEESIDDTEGYIMQINVQTGAYEARDTSFSYIGSTSAYKNTAAICTYLNIQVAGNIILIL